MPVVDTYGYPPKNLILCSKLVHPRRKCHIYTYSGAGDIFGGGVGYCPQVTQDLAFFQRISTMTTKTTTVECFGCQTLFQKETKYVTIANKRNRNHFCSLSCQTSFRCRTDPRFRHNENLKRGGDNKSDQYSPFRFYLRRANSRKNNNNLTLDHIKNCWESQQGLCIYTGLPLKLNGKHTSIFDCASLDRIDSSRPYEEGNIQFTSASLNFAKNNATDQDFRAFLDLIKAS